MMRRAARTFALASALASGLSGPAWGAEDGGTTGSVDRAAQLEQQVRQLQSRVAELEQETGQDGHWMNERRAEQVKALVHEVLADAETRATLLQEGLTAGHDGHFFIQSADGAYRLELAGHLQTRYIWNSREGAHDADPGADDNEAGFQIRRAKFKGEGHIADPRLGFAFSIAADRDDAETVFEDYTLSYDFTDQLSVVAGRWKQPFAIQEMVSSSRQLAMERSLVHEVFNVGRSEGVGVSYAADRFRAYGTVNDGIEASFSDFDENMVDVAFVGRGEVLLAGEWGQFRDPGVAWEGEPTGAMLGGAVYYGLGETGSAADNDNRLRWTADASFESGGFGALAVVYGNHTDTDSGNDFDDYGLLVEAGYFIVPDVIQPFARYELIMQDDARAGVGTATEEETSLVTAGFNWYQHKHNAKFTMDVVYAFDPITGDLLNPSTGLGLLDDADGEDGQLAVRAQYQLTW